MEIIIENGKIVVEVSYNAAPFTMLGNYPFYRTAAKSSVALLVFHFFCAATKLQFDWYLYVSLFKCNLFVK